MSTAPLVVRSRPAWWSTWTPTPESPEWVSASAIGHARTYQSLAKQLDWIRPARCAGSVEANDGSRIQARARWARLARGCPRSTWRCWDLKAKANGEPLWRTLGASTPRVRAYASGLDSPLSDEELYDYYAGMAARGVSAGKLKGGANRPGRPAPAGDHARCARHVRQTGGRDAGR